MSNRKDAKRDALVRPRAQYMQDRNGHEIVCMWPDRFEALLRCREHILCMAGELDAKDEKIRDLERQLEDRELTIDALQSDRALDTVLDLG